MKMLHNIAGQNGNLPELPHFNVLELFQDKTDEDLKKKITY